MIELLNSCLADVADLQTHAKHAHWNVKGPQFLSLHDLFEQIASRLAKGADTIAERITALGGLAQGTARQVSAASNVPTVALSQRGQYWYGRVGIVLQLSFPLLPSC